MIKKDIWWIVALVLIVPFLVWGGALAKCRVLTAMHEDTIETLPFAEYEEPLQFDWYRVTAYSEGEIEIYFVNGTDGEYKIGGTITVYETSNGWNCTEEHILWSGAGSADTYVWPYWHHVFLV